MNELGHIVLASLRQARWLPAAESSIDPSVFSNLSAGDDLLPLLAAVWSNAELSPADRRRGRQLACWTEEKHAAGARLTVGPDTRRFSRFERWAGRRLVWWPNGIPAGNYSGLLSSHLGHKVSRKQAWFRTIRAACARIDPQTEVLVTAATTTPHEYVRRAAELFEMPLLTFVPPGKRQGLAAWLNSLDQPTRSADVGHAALVSPELVAPADRSDASALLADRLVIAMSERLLVLHLLPAGKLRPLIARRVADPSWDSPSVFLALGADLVPRSIARELLDAGAVGWVTPGAMHRASRLEDRTPDQAELASPEDDSTQIINLAPDTDWCYLSHCTRAARRAWPDQPRNAYLDELLFSAHEADHSAFASLRRILTQQRILATSSAIRGGVASVSFTSVDLRELSRLRTFRAHRGQWDFQPYGICLKQDWLKRAGARPVLYRESSDWEDLPTRDRPFFQQRYTVHTATGETIDWSCECEWRLLGDVDLRLVDAESALVFVPSIKEARALVAVSNWPIVVLD